MLARWSQYAALPLRLGLGVAFAGLGSQKLFGYFGGAGLEATAQALASAGVTPGAFWAWVVGLVELLGGAALILGVLTRWTALALAIESLVAIVVTLSGVATNVPFRIATLGALVALGLIGPQRYALDTTVPALASWAEAPATEPARKAA